MRHCRGGGPDASTRTSAAPVGVVASPSTGPPLASSTPSNRIAVAGAGTGSRPCSASTHPFPTATGQAYTASTPSCSNPSIAPTMSSTASTAPTSCKCTFSGATPCTWPSASPTSRNARMARSFTQSETGARSTSRTGSPSSQTCGTPRARSAPKVMSPEMPAAGSKIAMRIRLKRRNINGLGPVQPPGTSIEDHDPIVRPQHPPRLELDGSRERSSTLRSGIDALEGLQVAGRRGEKYVGDCYRPTPAFAQGAEYQAIPQGGRDSQARGDRLWVGPWRATLGPGLESTHDGRAPRGLHAVQAGRFSLKPVGADELGEGLPHADQPRAATGGIHDRVGHGPAELLRQLEAQSFLALDAVRLAQRGHVNGTGLRSIGAGRLAAVADVPIHEYQVAAEAADLAEDGGGRGGRCVHASREASARGVGRERHACVSCRGHDQPLGARERGTSHGGG